jgi:TonB family protein
MKKFWLFLGLCCLIAYRGYSQQNIFDLNDFKLIYLPSNGIDEKYDVNAIIKNKLTKSGFSVATSRLPIQANPDLDTCLVLTCEVVHSSSKLSLSLERDEVYVYFFDCKGEIVYRCSALTGIKVAAKLSYQNACIEALRKFDNFRYDFNPVSQRRLGHQVLISEYGFKEDDTTAVLLASADSKIAALQKALDVSLKSDNPQLSATNFNNRFEQPTKDEYIPPPILKSVEVKPFRVEEYSLSSITNRQKNLNLPAIFNQSYTNADEIIAQSLVSMKPFNNTIIETGNNSAIEVSTTEKKLNLPAIFNEGYTRADELIGESIIKYKASSLKVTGADVSTNFNTTTIVSMPTVATKVLITEADGSLHETSSTVSNDAVVGLINAIPTLLNTQVADEKCSDETSTTDVLAKESKAIEVANQPEVSTKPLIEPAPAEISVSTSTMPVALNVSPPEATKHNIEHTDVAVANPVKKTLIPATNISSSTAMPVSSVATNKYGLRVAPEFPGGVKKMFDFIKIKMKYPAGATADGIEGKVHIGFVIDKNGFITSMTIEKSLREDLDMEAIRIIGAMPPWRPALQSGEPVKAKVIIPITFSLKR